MSTKMVKICDNCGKEVDAVTEGYRYISLNIPGRSRIRETIDNFKYDVPTDFMDFCGRDCLFHWVDRHIGDGK